jgi:hypothetical protein
MSNSLARHRTHSSKTLNADRDRRHARSSRELAPDPLMAAALDCFSLTLKVHSKKAQTLAPGCRGVPERRTHSYVRHGTTSLFAALDVASGFVIGKCYKRHPRCNAMPSLTHEQTTLDSLNS